MHRLPFFPLAVLLCTGLALLPACSKKEAGGVDNPPVTPAQGTPPDTVKSEYLLFAHLNAKDILGSTLFTELKQAVTKAGGTAEWDMVEKEISKEIGIKPTDIDTVTLCVTEIPLEGEPKFVLIVKFSKAIDKSTLPFIRPGAKPDARGFYTVGRAQLHFPNEKTFVLISQDLTQKYLDGYGKDRTGWPLNAELAKTATGHTAFAVIQMDKIPAEAWNERSMRQFAPLSVAKTVTLTADLKGKELSVAGRATFPDAASAGKAKDLGQDLLNKAADAIDEAMKSKKGADLTEVMPLFKEAHRALKAARVEVSGSDLTLVASYKADFDFGAMVVESVKKVRTAAARMKASNNFNQLAIAMHNYASTYDDKIAVHGIGMNGAPLKDAKDKPLLSWRVAMLPYIEQDNLYKQFRLNEPWDSEHNKKLIEKMPKIFEPVGKPVKPGYTHTQMVIGQNAMQPGRFTIANIPDGASNTIMLVEAAEPVIWTKPDDVMLPAKLGAGELKKKFGGIFPRGFTVAMWDGSVRFVSDAIKEETLRLALDPADGQPLPADW